MKHSPGPWKWEGQVLVDANGCTVAHTYTCVADWNTSPADRALIEAGTELLEALRERVLRCFCKTWGNVAGCDLCHENRALIARIERDPP